MNNSELPTDTQAITTKDFLIFGFMLGCVIFVLRFVLFCLCISFGMGGVLLSLFIIPEQVFTSFDMSMVLMAVTSLLLGYCITAILTCRRKMEKRLLDKSSSQ